MREHGDQTDVALPTALALVQRGFADDSAASQHQHRQVLAKIRLAAPLAKQEPVGHGLFDEQPLLLRHGEEKILQACIVAPVDRAHHARRSVPQGEVEREFFEGIIK